MNDGNNMTAITKVYEKDCEPRSLLENGFVYVPTSKAYETVEEDGLSFGYPIDQGVVVNVVFTKVSETQNEELQALIEAINAFQEPKNRASPRYVNFFDFEIDEDDFDNDEAYFNCVKTNTQRCESYIKDGSVELVHKFHSNGERLYRVEQDVGAALYFISSTDMHNNTIIDYDFIKPSSHDSLSLCISFAISEDDARYTKKEAEKEYRHLIFSITKQLAES